MRFIPCFLLAACTIGGKDGPLPGQPPGDTGDDTGPGTTPSGPPITVRVVDESGELVPVDEVIWYNPLLISAPADALPAACASGEPPCAEWTIEGDIPRLVHVAGSRWQPDADPGVPKCFYYAAAFRPVFVPDPPTALAQVVHLTLPSDALYCYDGTGASLHPLAPEHPDDLLYVPDLPDQDGLVVRIEDQDGQPAPVARAAWYYPPKSERYDGEHFLACANAICSAWVLEGEIDPGEIYVNATYWGPPHPEKGTFWMDFAATPLQWTGEPRDVLLSLRTDLEAAF